MIKLKFWEFAKSKKRSRKVTIGEEAVLVEPITIDKALRILVILAPYLPFLENKLPELNEALKSKKENKPQLLSSLIRVLFEELKDAPGTIVNIFSILIGRDSEWVARNVKPDQFVKTLIELDEINNFAEWIQLIRSLGVEVNYITATNEESMIVQ